MKKANKYFKNVTEIVIMLAVIVNILAVILGCFWLAKTGSYSFFYEDMVIKTITQQIKPEYLKN